MNINANKVEPIYHGLSNLIITIYTSSSQSFSCERQIFKTRTIKNWAARQQFYKLRILWEISQNFSQILTFLQPFENQSYREPRNKTLRLSMSRGPRSAKAYNILYLPLNHFQEPYNCHIVQLYTELFLWNFYRFVNPTSFCCFHPYRIGGLFNTNLT